MGRFEASVRELGDETVISLHGMAGIAEAEELERFMAGVEAGAPLRVCLDLRDLEFISSQGIGVLVALARGVWGRKGRIRAVGTQARVAEVFVRCRMEDLIPMEDEAAAGG